MMTSGAGAPTAVYPRGRPRNLMAESEAATERGIAARAETRRLAAPGELLRLQGLLDNPVVPSAVPPVSPDTIYDATLLSAAN